ncbi:class IV adenylate cyclase [Candidatus Pacearchaeota archaeon]|nr:class IV adenylate cyclase [Candidatus Pacearchaeota archaeon]
MIEVESKIKVRNPKEIRRRIRDFAKFSGKEEKIDDYYALNTNHYPKKSLRIRKRKGIYEVNFKQRISYKKGIHAKKESEFNVSDIKNFVELIKDFGFRKWLRKEKLSEVYTIKKNFHVELNKVKNLGWFLEVEYLAEENEIAEARREVVRIMRLLGLKKKDVVKEGYTKMLWDKIH